MSRLDGRIAERNSGLQTVINQYSLNIRFDEFRMCRSQPNVLVSYIEEAASLAIDSTEEVAVMKDRVRDALERVKMVVDADLAKLEKR